MARKQTKKKVKLSGPPVKHRQGYRGRIAPDSYVINRSDILKFDGTTALLYRDGVAIYQKEMKEKELSKYIRLISDYGDTVLNKYFQPVEEQPTEETPSSSEPQSL